MQERNALGFYRAPQAVRVGDPLRKGRSNAAIEANVEKLIAEGYEPEQAVAIAYEAAGRAKR